jgi:hypothetical protein
MIQSVANCGEGIALLVYRSARNHRRSASEALGRRSAGSKALVRLAARAKLRLAGGGHTTTGRT